MEAHVAGILLAAGAGRRLGQPKALVDLGGRPLAARGVALLREGGAAPVIVVTGAAAVNLTGVITVHNPHWATGMGSSLAAGLATVPDECEAAVVALVDQPLVGAAAVRRLIAAYQGGASVAVAAYGGQPRNPVLLGSPALGRGDRARGRRRRGRAFLRARPDLVTLVECGDTGSPDDIDTTEDLARITGLLPDQG